MRGLLLAAWRDGLAAVLRRAGHTAMRTPWSARLLPSSIRSGFESRDISREWPPTKRRVTIVWYVDQQDFFGQGIS